MRVRARTLISSSIGDVWRVVSDPDSVPRFLASVTRWLPAGGPARGLAARYDVRMLVGAVELGGIVEIVEWQEPHAVGWTSVTGITQRGRICLREMPDAHTEVTMELSYVAPGPLGKVADVVALPLLRRQVRRSLRRLRAVIEPIVPPS